MNEETYTIELPDQKLTISKELLEKYDKVGPRYTSYPTAPEWESGFSLNEWKAAIDRSNTAVKDVSLYFHIPFCRSACYYCACNFVVSQNASIADQYLNSLDREIELYGQMIDKKRKIKQLHFGGGTPTHLNCQQLKRLIDKIGENFNLDRSPDAEYSVEVDPRVTSFEQLKLFRDYGFNRVSLGVQDFDTTVQEAVNRIQSYEMIEGMLNYCREIGYQSINFDLIYGLPHQTLESFKATLQKVIQLNPDRIALFNYAHLPSLRPFQKAHIDESKLPDRNTKLLIFCEAMKQFCANDYEYIGMDHFAKANDELCAARQDRTLHRNFQGYTTKAGCDLFGLGMTSISSIDNVFAQNEKKLNRYMDFFNDSYHVSKLIPLEKGFKCSFDDTLRKSIISKLLCHGVLLFEEVEREFSIDFSQYFENELINLKALEADGLIELTKGKITVTSLGRIFLRNIGMIFDAYLHKGNQRLFSRTV